MKTDCATARIPELDFEIPAFSQKGGGYGAGPPPLPPSGPAAAPERCPCASVLSLSSSDHHRRHNRQSCHGPGAGPACPLGKLLWHRNPLRDLVHACFVAPLALRSSNQRCYGLWFVLLTALSSAPSCPQHRSQMCLPFRRQQTKRWQVKSMSSLVN